MATPPPSDFDTQLMLQVQAGDTEAANKLVRRNFQRVSRYIARVVRNAAAVEDLTHDVFLRVLRNPQGYQPKAKFSTWLYRIATNAALNYVGQAHEKRRSDAGDEVTVRIPARGDSSPDHRLSLGELRAGVSAAISSLPIKQRIALTLYEYEEFSYEQIAIVLDSTADAVRCQLRRAREALRAKLSSLT
ncbi:MAG: sigma-70 family RNA polymerase sigma factor [Phycisphaerae bacterium]